MAVQIAKQGRTKRDGVYNERDGLNYREKLVNPKQTDNRLEYFIRTASEEEDLEEEKHQGETGTLSGLSVIAVVAHTHVAFFQLSGTEMRQRVVYFDDLEL